MARRFFFFWVFVAGLVAFGALKVEVKNLPTGRTNLVVHCRLTAEQASEASGKALVAEGSGEAVPYELEPQADGSELLSILLPGTTGEGDARVFVFREGVPATAVTDLAVQEQGGKLLIRNQYYALRHAQGLPGEITFVGSGNRVPELSWLDRLYSKELGGQFHLKEAGQVRLVSRTPLRAVVEVVDGYAQDGKPAPGTPRAAYRFVYTAFSPVIEVACEVSQEGEESWPEVDVCQLSTGKRLVFDRWLGNSRRGGAIQRKLSSSAVEGGEQGLAYPNGWLVMANAQDAVGLNGPATAHDAQKSYVYYLKSNVFQKLEGKRASGKMRLYLGPAVNDTEWYEGCLTEERQPLVLAYFSDEAAAAALPGAQEFDFDELVLSFADVAHGHAVAGIRAKAGGPQFCVAAEPRPLWRLEFRRGCDAAEGFRRSALDVPMENTSMAREGDTVVLRWKDVPVDETGTADVTARAKVTGQRIDWTLEVENRSTASGLWESEFPILSEVSPAGRGDVLTPSVNLGGQLFRNNAEPRYLSPYPGSGCPVQMMAFLRDGYGLYFAAHDGEAWYKQFCVTNEQDVYCKLPAENCGVPGAGQRAAFAFATEIFQGDWWKAAKLYRAWASKNAAWLRHGLVRDNPDYPKEIQEVCYWFQTWADGPQMREKLSKYVQNCPVKHGMHWYNWHEIQFDTHYPEYNPAKPEVPEVTKEAVARGQVVMPYINGHIWDQDVPSFAAEGRAGAALKPNGETYLEIYPSKARQAPMCPASEVWQKKIFEVCQWLLDDVGVNAIYLDQIGAHRPDFCFSTAHGHPLGGGHHWVSGYRKMLSAVNAYAKAQGKPLFLTTENTSDPYMDNIHGFLTWTERMEHGVPLLPAIYSGYTYYFACPASPQDSLLAFRMSQGHDFLWGVQFGWNSDFLQREKYAEYWKYEMELAKLRAATLDFLSRGELMGELKPKNQLPTVTETWHWHVNRGAKDRVVTLPAVEGSYWQDGKGDFCLYIINYSDQAQLFEYDLPLRGSEQVQLTRVSPAGRTALGVAQDGATWRSYLRPREVLAMMVEPLRDGLGANAQLPGFKVEPQIPLVPGEFPQATFRFDDTAELPEGLAVEVAGRKFPVDRASRSVTVELPRGADQELFEAQVAAPGLASVSVPLQLVARPFLEVALKLPERVFAGTPFACEVTVVNHAAEPQNAEVLLQLPTGWKRLDGDGALLRFDGVPAHQANSMAVTCVADESAATDAAEVRALVILGSQRAKTRVLPPRVSCRARKAAGIVVDGDLGEWSDDAVICVGEATPEAAKYQTHAYGGDADLSCQLRLAWDAEFLYLAAEVRDDLHVDPLRTPEVWKGDAIQFALRAGGPANAPGEPGLLCEFAVGVDATGGFVQTWNNLGHYAHLAHAVGQTAGDLTTLECAIPWKLLGLPAPQLGEAFGFSFVVADNDAPDTPIAKLSTPAGYLEFTPGIFYGKDPSRYARLTLEE